LTFADAVPDQADDPRDTVARLVGHELAVHARAMVQGWSAAHLDEHDGVHAMRVSTRRLRSVLATGRPFLDRTTTEPLREEVGWLADLLGEARDAEVQAARIHEAVDTLVAERADLDWEAEHVLPALLAPLRARHDDDLGALREALESRRYAELVGCLDVLVSAPPWTPDAEQRIADAYLPRMVHEVRRLKRRMRAATQPDLDPDDRATALHHARKAAKRTRYAVEPLRPSYGKPAAKLTHRLKRLQTELGQLQDTAITRDYLHELAHSEPSVDPAVALVAGALIEREAAQAEGFHDAAMHAWRRVRRSDLPR